MLITFKTDIGDVMMFGDVALTMIKMMGHTPTVPGAILAEDVPLALEKLRAAVEEEKAPPPAEDEHKDEDKRVVSITDRALPLINLLAAAAKAKSNVMWDK